MTSRLNQVILLTSSLLLLFVVEIQSETPKLLPLNDNQDFRTEKDIKTFESRNLFQDYLFYPRYFDEEILKENGLKKSSFIPLKDIRSKTCNCGDAVPEHVDLGIDYVPRYLTTGFCKVKQCALGFCKPVHYKVSVLRKKGNEEDVTSPSLPLELSENYVREIKTVTAGCTCRP